MIKRFLKLNAEAKAKIVIWLYDRYVMDPAMQQMEEDGCFIEFEPEWVPDNKVVIH